MIKIDIYTKDVELTPAIKEYVEKKVGSLEKFSKNGIPFEVTVELDRTTHHHNKGLVFRAELQMQIPGGVIRAESTKEDLRAAIDEAKDNFERELRETKEKKKDLTKSNGRIIRALMSLSSLARFKKRK